LTHGAYLFTATVVAVGLLLVLILAVKMHAFLAMLISSMGLGLAAGMPGAQVLKSIQTGVGDALSFVAVVVALGAMLGRFTEYSGGGRVLADWLLEKFGLKRASWAGLATGFLVGLPVFFEVGFVILAPLTWNLAKESKKSLLFFALPMAAALTLLHSLAPPHPAPSVAAQMLGADMGRTILFGVALSIPLMIVSGIWYGTWISRRISPALPALADEPAGIEPVASRPPSVGLVVSLLALPVILIFAATVADLLKLPGKAAFDFIGHPFSALLITVLAAGYFLGTRRGLTPTDVTRLATDSLKPLATLLLIIGGGGAFKQVIVDCGVAPYAGQLLASTGISPLLIAFLLAVALRGAAGSATVAIVTTAGILAPLMKQFSSYRPEMLVLAVCCGGTALSHVNDAGFWIVKEYLGMTVSETLQSWTVMKLISGVVGISLLLAVQSLWF
jgi:gluconate transporter